MRRVAEICRAASSFVGDEELNHQHISTHAHTLHAGADALPACSAMSACANCGKHESSDDDAVKLKKCTACRLVEYCSVDCQRAHRKQHKKACKLRAAELKDEQLYEQGKERPEESFCPICTLPIPLPLEKHSGFHACCMKKVCHGCGFAAMKRGMFDCPFCRAPEPSEDNASILAKVQKRVDAKDPEAIYFLGTQYYFGGYGIQIDIPRAIELWTEAAELGSTDAHYSLAKVYAEGDGVEQNQAKAVQHWEVAARQGHDGARYFLGRQEHAIGNYKRAIRHYLISAKMGNEKSLEHVKDAFSAGLASKQQFAEALKGYQDSTEEMKSPERDQAKARLDQLRKDGKRVD